MYAQPSSRRETTIHIVAQDYIAQCVGIGGGGQRRRAVAVSRGDQAEQQRRARNIGELFIAIQRGTQPGERPTGQVAIDLGARERLDDERAVDLERR